MQLQRNSIRDQVRRTITERILAGKYAPGERIIELQLARELGVSQGTIREALRELEVSRLIESEPNRGCRVRVITPRESREAYLVRGVLEEAAALTAAKSFKRNTALLRIECEAIIQAAEAGDAGTQAIRNTTFHRMIMEACGNSVLLRLWDSLAFETRTRVRLARIDIDPVADAKTHWPIVEALDRGDGKKAGRLLREHAESFAPPETYESDQESVN